VVKNRNEFQLIKLIRKLEIFQDLSKEEALRVLRMCQQKSFAAGEVVWRPEAPGDSMLVLLSGKLHVTDPQGRLIGEVCPGGSFGEMACLSGSPRFVGFQAVEPSTALSLLRSSLRGLIGSQPLLYVRILKMTIKVLALRIRRTRSGASSEIEDEGEQEALSPW
jgi:CRP/FNR family transcriptional regulator